MTTCIIIGTYNNAPHIGKTVQSVIEQSDTDWHCIIIDNGSSDETFAITEKLVDGDARFRVFKKENEGPGSGRNFGYEKSGRGYAFIHFLDGDDVLHRDFIKTMTAYLVEHPHVVLVGCHYTVIDEHGNFLRNEIRSRYAPGLFGFPRKLKLKERNTPFESFFSATGQGPFAVMRGAVFDQTSGYEVEFWSHEDSDIFCQMALRGEVHYLPERLYHKRVHSTNLTRSPKANYGKFRRKWDAMKTGDPAADAKISRALSYYYGRHAPIRSLKVAMVSLLDFLRRPRLHVLRWSWTCFRKGIMGLLTHKPQ